VFYTLVLASSQILLKVGTLQLGHFSVKGPADIFPLLLVIIRNPMIVLGTVLMASSFFLWLYILSWFKIGQVFPMTALVYVFVALMSYFLLGERLSTIHYFGIALVTAGIGFLLYK
jgi:drug/metabolite transporter (DMT)-like permease